MKDNDEESDQKFEHNSSDDNSSSKDDESSDDKEDVMCYLGIDNLSHGTQRTRDIMLAIWLTLPPIRENLR